MLQLTEILCLKLQIICVGPSCRPWSLGKQCDKIVLPTNFMNSRTVYRTCTYRMRPTHSAFAINDNKFHPFSSKSQLDTKFSDYPFVLFSFFFSLLLLFSLLFIPFPFFFSSSLGYLAFYFLLLCFKICFSLQWSFCFILF